jgi:hydroxypyruvate isomerase
MIYSDKPMLRRFSAISDVGFALLILWYRSLQSMGNDAHVSLEKENLPMKFSLAALAQVPQENAE